LLACGREVRDDRESIEVALAGKKAPATVRGRYTGGGKGEEEPEAKAKKNQKQRRRSR
jgi:hypothetical protein